MEPLKFLSNEDVQAMHEATLKILHEVGVIWTHKPSLDILLDAGCTMNGNRVCFPPDLVMACIAKANSKFARCMRARINARSTRQRLSINMSGSRTLRFRTTYANLTTITVFKCRSTIRR